MCPVSAKNTQISKPFIAYQNAPMLTYNNVELCRISNFFPVKTPGHPAFREGEKGTKEGRRD